MGPHREGANGVPTARLGFENKFSRKTKYSEIRRAMVAGKYSIELGKYSMTKIFFSESRTAREKN
jgi:hypothetical protein